ncbi:hypothetical protein RCL1_007363 [Eukaryota sp. TZLM3-RCL]
MESNFLTFYNGSATIYRRGNPGAIRSNGIPFEYNYTGVKLGHLGSMNHLAWYHRTGLCHGVEKNPQKAASLWSLAVLYGCVYALYPLSLLYLDGDLGVVDKELAQRLLEEGTRHNSAVCMSTLVSEFPNHPHKEHLIAEVNRLEVGKPPKPAKKKRVNAQQTSQSCPVQPRVATPLEPVQRPPLPVNNNPQDDVIKALMEQRKRAKANRK